MRLPSGATAGKILMSLLVLLLLMHVLILARVIPYDVIWGGNIKDESQLYVFEISALVINGLFLLITAIKLGYVTASKLNRAASIGMWITFAYFAMNTIGNLSSGVSWEKLLFAPLSIVLALLSLRVAAHRQTP
jgi:hypothetical protein